VAISTNGQSPTFAKRFRQWLEAELPEAETTNLIDNLKVFRDRLTGDFQSKVRALNSLTQDLLGGGGLNRSCPSGVCLLAAASREEMAPAAPPEDVATFDDTTPKPPVAGGRDNTLTE
jgi:precorrin-2 dehydrogenase/sirohydrochlorin ferrochelatase